jgi:hypothetical protein
MGNEVSAWRKVFLRNGLIWTPYLIVLGIPAGLFDAPGWKFGLSDTMNKVLTFSVLVPVWFAMAGGGMCIFRWNLQWVVKEMDRGGKLPVMRWRWFWSYFLEVDERYRLRP